VRRPQVFLMDEPLSNLDAKLRVQMRAELISLHKRVGITTIYVTHDQTEAMTLGDRVVVMNRGLVQQVDTPERLYRQPANTFVAGFIGSPAMNLFNGQLSGRSLRLGAHSLELPAEIAERLGRRDGPVIAGLRPEDIVLARNGDATIPAVVAISERLGPEVIVHLRAEGLDIAAMGEQAAKTEDEETGDLRETVVARFDASFAGDAGDPVGLTVKTDRLQFFDATSGASLLV
jgi:multiple sugar transport system ATP-binding protein